jgi:nicotinate-nucleotide adenylyltransferase
MRIGIFGGTFDPVHFGHLLLAECCREQCPLDEVWFLPAAIPPHKQHETITPAEDRVAMLQLAIGGHESFHVCRLEVDRGGVNYTAESLAALRNEHPSHEWLFLMGSDSLVDLRHWRDPAEVCKLAMPVVVRRPGSPPLDFSMLASLVSAERLRQIERSIVDMPQIDFRSRELRALVKRGRSIRYRTPRAVEKYIETHALYRSDERTAG